MSAITGIGTVILPVSDQDRAIEFYEALGFEKRTDVSSSAVAVTVTQ